MIDSAFIEMVKEIKEKDKEFKITPRKIIAAFGCEKRTKGNLYKINKYLEGNQLETVPDFITQWIDAEISLKHQKKAKSKQETDPIQRIQLLQAANSQPISVNRDSKLNEAITLMMLHNYSQLPVMNGPRSVIGAITWESVGYGLANGCKSEDVKDYIINDAAILDYNTPLLEAIAIIIKKEFVLVQKSDKTICGIVTIADISKQFLSISEPFLLLEQIEKHIRQILDGKFLLKELQDFCSTDDPYKKIEHIDDLTFGDYIRIIEKPEHWDKLKLTVDRSHFIKQLDKVREIRNDVMHFDPEGLSDNQKQDLLNMAKFLMEVRKFNS
jgi:predicted transcriptional regulator